MLLTVAPLRNYSRSLRRKHF